MVNDAHLRTDLRIDVRHSELRPVYVSAETTRKIPQRTLRATDFALTTGRDNLAQAVIMRLLTPRGELTALGHPTYGSRLHELVGRRNLATNLALMRLYILESLKQEPRIDSVALLQIEPASRDRINVYLEVHPVEPAGETAAIPISFALEVPA
ncbi:MAG: hypothetical protein ACFB2W_25705 [Leptolyngbyaceae cyanobacterium]